MPSSDLLERFLQAQKDTYATALHELQAGQKRSHWMWFIFPQIDGLGFSPTAQYYAIKSLNEARDYLAHPLLGPRLRRCVEVVNTLEGKSASQIFGYPDHLKFRSSMTLFELVAGTPSDFSMAIDKYYSGQRDQATLDIIRACAR